VLYYSLKLPRTNGILRTARACTVWQERVLPAIGCGSGTGLLPRRHRFADDFLAKSFSSRQELIHYNDKKPKRLFRLSCWLGSTVFGSGLIAS